MPRRSHLAVHAWPLACVAVMACSTSTKSPLHGAVHATTDAAAAAHADLTVAPDAAAPPETDPGPCPDRVPLVRNGKVVDPCGCCPLAGVCGEGYAGGSPHPVFDCSWVKSVPGACTVGTDANGCPRYDWVGTPQCTAPVDPACGPDAAAWSGPQPASTLPGESTACQALGIAACEFDDAPFEDSYVCFDAAGKLVYSGSVEPGEVPTWTPPADLPCSATQLAAWLAAYENPCWKKVPAAALPASALTQLLDPAQVPAEVCSNVSGTRFRWNAGCALVLYDLGCVGWPSAEPAPPYCTDNGGGNTHGSWWKLTVTPPVPGVLVGSHPFLACCSYGVDGYDWSFTVKRNEVQIALQLDDVAVGDGTEWSEVVDRADAWFTACGDGYYW